MAGQDRDDERAKAVAFLHQMAGECVTLAGQHGFDTLAQCFAMAALEAKIILDPDKK